MWQLIWHSLHVIVYIDCHISIQSHLSTQIAARLERETKTSTLVNFKGLMNIFTKFRSQNKHLGSLESKTNIFV